MLIFNCLVYPYWANILNRVLILHINFFEKNYFKCCFIVKTTLSSFRFFIGYWILKRD